MVVYLYIYTHLFNSTDKLIGIHLIIQTILISIVAQLPPASRAKLYSHFPCVFLPPPQFGDSQQLRLVRILRSTVMVRVGGGWMALDEFLVKNDPCRGEFSKSAIRNAALSTWLCLRRNLKFRNAFIPVCIGIFILKLSMGGMIFMVEFIPLNI